MKYDIKWLGPQMFGVKFPDGRLAALLSPGDIYHTFEVPGTSPSTQDLRDTTMEIDGFLTLLVNAGCTLACFDPSTKRGMEIYEFNPPHRAYAVLVPVIEGVLSAYTIKPKKVLSDLCPKCQVPGKFGARATLLCPKCNYVIGGLG